ncbi:hypothetical protein [Methylocapsa acidiphila]|uniref:hypothetical protein n=1 Tax=Methylocapsa acidiphila TaxID=133552 RepID=UPI000403DAAC|nr:hypothetical protein [Methylocapsa acidiphila]
MGYLAPPPMPAPVVVTKDVGGYVTDYQAQTEIYRSSDREVRLHECRSACTLALSLPNVCVYPDSILKFHLAYDPRNHQTDANVSQQLFDSYPPAVRARLGGLTREYKVLRGSELIGLGVRNCNEDRVMVAARTPRKTPPSLRGPVQQAPAEQGSIFAGLMQNLFSGFGDAGSRADAPRDKIAIARAGSQARLASAEAPATETPLPPPRPADVEPGEIALTEHAPETGSAFQENAKAVAAPPLAQTAMVQISEAPISEAPLPPQRPMDLSHGYAYRLAAIPLPKIITGAQPILPPGFGAYAPLSR